MLTAQAGVWPIRAETTEPRGATISATAAVVAAWVAGMGAPGCGMTGLGIAGLGMTGPGFAAAGETEGLPGAGLPESGGVGLAMAVLQRGALMRDGGWGRLTR